MQEAKESEARKYPSQVEAEESCRWQLRLEMNAPDNPQMLTLMNLLMISPEQFYSEDIQDTPCTKCGREFIFVAFHDNQPYCRYEIETRYSGLLMTSAAIATG